MRLHDFFDNKIQEHIVKVKGGYRLVSKHGGKNLGTYPTHAGAEKRERQVQYFKHAGESVEEGFKNEYSVGDRVDTPMGSATIVALSPNINQDGKVKVKLDDPSQAGEDGKHRDTFTITTSMCKHISESDISGLLNASKLNKSFLVTAKTAEGDTKQYRVKAQSERVAREKFSKHYSMAKILDIKEEA